MSFELRKYQTKAIEDLRSSILGGSKRIVLVAPCGSGKTVIAAQVVKQAADKGNRVMFLAHRRELIYQCADKLVNFGVDHGILMAGEYPYGAADCQVASIDTLRARCMTTKKLPFPNANIIIIDEAHRSLAKTYIDIIERYTNAIVIGLTATPIRGDGKGLAHVYHDMVKCPSIAGLTRLGHLVPARTFAPTIPDLTGVPIKGGDYDKTELEIAMDRRRLVGDVVTHWFRLASDRPSIVFASGVKHSVHLRDEFRRQGVVAAHVDGDTPIAERKEIITDLKEGKVQVVCNYAVLTEGFDEPRLGAGVLARPTKNLGLYLQMAGRPLRPFRDKEDTLLIDHSGNVYEHGYVSDEHDWVLEEGKALEKSNADRQQEFDEKKPITCVECQEVYSGQLICPNCGHLPQKRGQYVESVSGELMEMRSRMRRSPKARKFSTLELEWWYRMLRTYGEEKGFKPGWAYHKYKAKFGEKPDRDFRDKSMEPSPECLSWIRGMNLRYIKAKEKEDAQANN